MTSNYFKELDEVSKATYLQKLTFDDKTLPDPLDETIRPHTFLRDVKLRPLVAFGDIYIYLVEEECVYTREDFKKYKALDSYNYFISGKVKNIRAYKNKKLDICIVTCYTHVSQTEIRHRPWIITTTNGMVHNGHCTCMAGLGKVCSHVAALLFALEVATREGPPASTTSVPCTWYKRARKVNPLPVGDMTFDHNRKNENRCKRPYVELQMPSTSAYNEFLKVIKETVPDAPILKMLSDEELMEQVSQRSSKSKGKKK